MMTIKYYGLVALACLTLVAGFVSCRQDDSIFEPTPHNQTHPKTKGKKANGQIVSLNLEAQTTLFAPSKPSKPRAMEYTLEGKSELPKLKLPDADGTIKVLTIFRKLGDESTTTYAYLDWTIVENDKGVKTLKYVGKLQLNEGTFVKDADDEWYMMGIIGGSTVPPGQKEEPTDENTPFSPENLYFVNDKIYETDETGKLTIDVPYILHWTKVNIVKDGEASNKTLKFKPLGNIFRVKVTNKMFHNYTLKGFRISSNYCCNRVAFNLQELDEEKIKLGEKSLSLSWQPELEYIQDAETFMAYSPEYKSGGYNYDDDNADSPLYTGADKGIWSAKAWPFTDLIGSDGSDDKKKFYMSYNLEEGHEENLASDKASKSYFVWMMPRMDTDVRPSASTNIYLRVRPTNIANLDDFEIEALPALSTGREFQMGYYHSILPKIDGDLIVNKVATILSEPEREDYETNIPEETKFVKDFSFVELYNPTASSIFLSNYALVKVAPGGNEPKFFNYMESSTDDLEDATYLPLRAIRPAGEYDPNAGSDPFAYGVESSDFRILPNGDYSEGTTPRYKAFYPNGNFRLEAIESGKSAVLLASGFLLDDKYLTEKEKKMRDDILKWIRSQVDEVQCIVAFSNGARDEAKGGFKPVLEADHSSYDYTHESGTLDIVPSMGFAIVKAISSRPEAFKDFKLVDISLPYGRGYFGGSNYDRDYDSFLDFYPRGHNGIPTYYGGLERPLPRAQYYCRIKHNDYPRMFPVYLPSRYSSMSYDDLWASFTLDAIQPEN